MADCTKTVDFLREWGRMCDGAVCFDCGIGQAKKATSGCRRYVMAYPEDAIAIVQKWSDEHPVLTWEGKLKELLPNHGLTGLCVCPKAFFGDHAPGLDTCSNDMTCVECWSGEYKEAPNG